MFKHVLPQVAPLLVANTVLMIALAIFAETFITFLGLGDPSTISWGRLIENAFTGEATINNAWWAIVPPGVCVTLVILACTMVGQSVEDALNPRLRVGHRLGAALPAAAARRQGGRRSERPGARWSGSRTSTSGSTLPGGGELHAVQGVTFELHEGERMGLVGESGCGKTTTILAMMGLLPASASVSGKVILDGEDILARGEDSISPHRWTDISMVFQGAMNAFNPVKTIGAQIAEPMELHGFAARQGGAARGWASCSSSSASRPIGPTATRTSSRAACASAPRSRWRSPARPKVLLADEPTTALDVMVQAQILELLDEPQLDARQGARPDRDPRHARPARSWRRSATGPR